jgi:hypothetical protein
MEQTTISDKQNSIEVNKNSKGYTWSIKLYYNEEKVDSDTIIDKIEQIDRKLQDKFKQGE